MSKFARIIKDNIYQDYTPQDLIRENVINFKNWSCSAGTEGLFIDWVGDVWPATCCVQGKLNYLGSIYNEVPILLLNDYIKCQSKNCPCLVEIFLPKYKIQESQLTENCDGAVSLNNFDAVTRASEHDRNRKYIMWAFGKTCNFDCRYCDDQSHSKNKNDMVTQFAIDKVLNYADTFRNNKSLMWSFTGGEPTINPLFLDLTKRLHYKGDTITVASNGSQTTDYYKELTKYANINISVHFEYIKPNKLKRVVSSIVEESPAWFGLNFMIMPGDVNKCYEYINVLQEIKHFKERTNLHFDILRIKNLEKFETYSSEELEKIKLLQDGKFR